MENLREEKNILPHRYWIKRNTSLTFKDLTAFYPCEEIIGDYTIHDDRWPECSLTTGQNKYFENT